jgi:type IX secretion system PorP/SprF family membrane protein
MRYNFWLFGMLMLACSISSYAQDLRFSQYYAAPQLYNPAFTGYFNGDVRAMAIYKSQWERPFNAYRTIGGGADFSILRKKLRGSGLGLGLHAFSDQAGDINFNTNQIHMSVAYTQKLSDYTPSYLSAGFQLMTANRSIDLNKAIFDNQSPGSPGFDNISVDNYWYVSLGLGLLWYFEPDDDVNFYVSGAVFNLLKPNQTFFTDGRDELNTRYTGQMGMQFNAGNYFSVQPGMLYQRQGTFQEVMIGSLFNYTVSDRPDQRLKLSAGVWYRVQDALIPVVRAQYDDFTVTFNYDINLSTLTRATRTNGGPEVSLIYNGWWSSDRKRQADKNIKFRCPVL